MGVNLDSCVSSPFVPPPRPRPLPFLAMSTLQGCCIHVAGRFKGTTHSTIEKDILDYGG